MSAKIGRLMIGTRGRGVGAVLARGSFTVLVVRSLAALLGLALQLLLARMLGVTDYGFFVFAMSWLMVLGMVSRMGMDSGLTRLVAQYRAQKSWGLLAGVLRWAMRNTLLVGMSVAALAGLAVWFLADHAPRIQTVTLWIAFLMLPLLSLSVLRQGALRGLKLVGKADLPEGLLRPAFLLLALLVFWLAGIELSAPGAMWLTLAAYGLAFLLGSRWLLQGLPVPVRNAKPEVRSAEWWRISLPLLFVQGMQVVLARLDVLMLGSMVGPDSTGVYGAVGQLATLVVFGLSVVNPIAAPMIAELFHTDRKRELQRVVTLAARLTTAVTVVAAIFLFFFGQWVLGLFGPEFAVGYTALMILLAGQMVNALSGSVGYLMTMTGHQNQSAVILVFATVVNAGLNWLLIPKYGIEGAAAATAISIATWNVAMLLYVRVKIGVRSTVF